MNKQFLLIITYGRSFGTLLMGVLNSIKGYRIMGENHDATGALMTYYDRMMNALASNDMMITNYNVRKAQNSWWNEFNPNILKTMLKEIVAYTLDKDGDNNVIGWKEINYPRYTKLDKNHSEGTNLYKYINFLHHLLDCKFILLTREKF